MKKPACWRITPVNHDDTLTYFTLLSDIDVRPKRKKKYREQNHGTFTNLQLKLLKELLKLLFYKLFMLFGFLVILFQRQFLRMSQRILFSKVECAGTGRAL